MKFSFTLLCLLALAGTVWAQEVDLVFVVGDGVSSAELRAGLDPAATNGIDAALGERELPPLPPSGTFEARFVSTGVPAELGQGSYRDYRAGSSTFEGEVAHRVMWQRGSGASIAIDYGLPDGVTARVEDLFGGVVLRETISGSGRLVVANGALTEVLLTIVYTSGVGTPITSEQILPRETTLSAPMPQPARGGVVGFQVGLPSAGPVRIAVYDVTGQQVAEVVRDARAAGDHLFKFDVETLPAGLYLVRLETVESVRTRSLVVVR